MKKYFLLFLIVLFSCSENENKNIELTFWAMGAEGEAVDILMTEFEKQYPEIKVKVQQIPWTAAQEKLITAFASNNLPDVFQLGNTWIPQFQILNAIEPLNEYVNSSENTNAEDFFKGIWDSNIIDSLVYGIPWYIDTRVLFYRTDILSEAGYNSPPKTWDELYDVSKKIKQHLKDENKFAIYLPTNEWAPFIIFGKQNGALLLKENNCYGNFSEIAFQQSFEFLVQFHHEKLAPIGISQVTNVYQAFKDEYFSMYISGPWNIKEFKQIMADSLKNSWSIAPLPANDNNYPGLSLAGGASLVVNSKSNYKTESWKLIEYLTRNDVQIKFYNIVSDLPSKKEVWKDPIFTNDPYMKAFYQQFKNVAAIPKIPEWEQIAFNKLQQYAEYVVRNKMSVDEALKALDSDVDRILKKRRWMLNKSE